MIFIFKKKFILFLILSIGILFRVYNLNYDDLWYDEIISFWVANPLLTFEDTKYIHNQIESTSILYNLILKKFYYLFGYSPFGGRFLSVIFGILSIFSIIYLDKKINKNNSYIFSAFLISLNIFLIGYSQELRNYSLFFLSSSLTIIFFIKYSSDVNNIRNLIIFSLILLINTLVHPFGFILLFSIFFYELLKAYFKNSFSIKMTIALLIILILSSLYYYQLFTDMTFSKTDYWWMKNPSLSFYSNFYFSNYFGSRLVGGVHLLILIYLIFKNFNEFKKINYLTFFLIIIIFSYIIPILFGYLFKPTITPRYIIFNLIPIVLLISSLTFKFETKKIKLLIIIILCSLTIGNHFTEQTLIQFFKSRVVYKPEYTSALNFINSSNYKEYTLLVEKMKDNNTTTDAINNYISYLSKINNFNVKYIPQSELISGKLFWYICFHDINEKSCAVKENIKKFNILEEKYFNRVNLKLLEIY